VTHRAKRGAVQSHVCVFRVLGESMWQGKRVSVILMTYAERASIRATIEGFFATGLVDEVLVVNNNAEPGTSEEVARTPAREVVEPRQGYG
jgi:glycosyltransferase involved in cell wall biosynthesis